MSLLKAKYLSPLAFVPAPPLSAGNSVYSGQGIGTAGLLSSSKPLFFLESRCLPGKTGDVLVGGWGMERAKDQAAAVRLWPQTSPLPDGHPAAIQGATTHNSAFA